MNDVSKRFIKKKPPVVPTPGEAFVGKTDGL